MRKSKVVAAICYRRHGNAIEFLLVRTKGGKKWTFPKGHVKKGERSVDAAAREACEEAGVIGHIVDGALDRYRYPSTRESSGYDEVEAYILEVQKQHDPEEPFRAPTWFKFREARRKLAEGRGESRYVGEHERVLTSALRTVTGGSLSP